VVVLVVFSLTVPFIFHMFFFNICVCSPAVSHFRIGSYKTVGIVMELIFSSLDVNHNFIYLINLVERDFRHDAAIKGCCFSARNVCIKLVLLEPALEICKNMLHDAYEMTKSEIDFENLNIFTALYSLSMSTLNDVFFNFGKLLSPTVKATVMDTLVKHKLRVKKRKQYELLLEDSYSDPEIAARALTTLEGIKTRKLFHKK